jgi:hypothetical protein
MLTRVTFKYYTCILLYSLLDLFFWTLGRAQVRVSAKHFKKKSFGLVGFWKYYQFRFGFQKLTSLRLF